ncbi:hypothetical protein BS47DRAFT_1371562 [Hydnum rufescens UP504]|uniref:DnaJ-domain-containing protein n=1 Tax=Hydnum rufescens UP504 TaxID=1448309 RepID=A0A9P6DX18_9AGAM|nr:hypothetical protein BS47DRAFT_1371562 [Hydnum rufescens UP504]
MASTEYYDLLGVSSDATTEEIKRAYKKKAMKHHPDKNPNDPMAAQTFQSLQNAYSTLLDPDSRAAYDRYGPDGPSSRMGGGGGGMGMEADELFAQFFSFSMGGGGEPSGFSRRGKPRRGEDSIIPYEVTLEDLYNGKTAHFNLEKNVVCGHCNGTGGKPKAKPQKCTKCDGRGITPVTRTLARGQIGVSQVTCPDCHGDGTRFREKERCKKCKGEKTVKEKKAVDVMVERGMSHNQKIVMKGEADQQPGVETGDVVFSLRMRPHATIHRAGSDLITTVHVTLSEALLGIHVERKRGDTLSSGDTIVIKSEGMPIQKQPSARGDLYIHFEVEMPTEEWLRSVLESVLPPKKPDLDPRPARVDVVDWEAADMNAYDEHEDEWEDEEDEEDEGGDYGDEAPECVHQ